jgi:beta-lactamase class A
VNKKAVFSVLELFILFTGFLIFPAGSSDLDVLDILFVGSVDLAGYSVTFDNEKTEQLKKHLENEIQKSGAEVSLALKDLESGEELLIHAEEMMHAASLMKVPVMIEVFRRAERAKFSLTDKIPVTNQFKSIVDGSSYSLLVTDDSDEDIYQLIGEELSIRDLAEHMITVSSNLATNILMELVGAVNVMETMKEMGIYNMEVLRGVEDTKAYERGLNNRTDALSMMQVMLSIAEGKAVSPGACKEMIEIMTQQKFRDKIPAGIPEGVKVANKTGSITRIDHDAAIVFPEGQRPYVLVVLTRGIEKREEAEQLISRLSRTIYQSLTKHKTR